MSDLWKDIRAEIALEKRRRHPQTLVSLALAKCLLADADALLKLVPACVALRTALLPSWQQDCVSDEERAILNAYENLPEYLRRAE